MIRAFVALALALAPALAGAGPRNDRLPGVGVDGSGNLAIPGAVDIAGAVEVSGTLAACGPGDTVCLDNNGIVGSYTGSTTDPDGLMLRPGPCEPSDGTCVAAPLCLAGGQDTTTIMVDGADPSATCPGAETVTVTVVTCDGETATALTQGVDWNATSSVSATCSSLAAAADALAGIGATCSSPSVLLTLGPDTLGVYLTESTIACTTVSVGTQAAVKVVGDLGVRSGEFVWLDVDGDSDTGIGVVSAGSDTLQMKSNGTVFLQSTATALTVGGATVLQPTLVLWTSTAFASLGTPGNGSMRYCADCTIANPCAGSGTGAFAKRLNGVWVCN